MCTTTWLVGAFLPAYQTSLSHGVVLITLLFPNGKVIFLRVVNPISAIVEVLFRQFTIDQNILYYSQLWVCMGAPDTGPKSKKFTNDDILRCFDEEHRRHVGKIELSAAEITEILNERVLSGDTSVTRQAVDNRLKELAGDELVRNEHGRSYLYARRTDIDDLFAPSGGGGGPIQEPQKESKASPMDLPGVFVLALLGWTAGWAIYKSFVLATRERDAIVGENGIVDPAAGTVDYKGLGWFFVAAVGASASFGAIAIMSLQALDVINQGFISAAVGYAVGFAGLVAMLYAVHVRMVNRHQNTIESDSESTESETA